MTVIVNLFDTHHYEKQCHTVAPFGSFNCWGLMVNLLLIFSFPGSRTPGRRCTLTREEELPSSAVALNSHQSSPRKRSHSSARASGYGLLNPGKTDQARAVPEPDEGSVELSISEYTWSPKSSKMRYVANLVVWD